MEHRGEILILDSGLVVTVSARQSDAYSYYARPLWAPADSPYQPGGNDIVLNDRDIAGARTVSLDHALVATLTAASEPTYESDLVVIGEKFEAPHPADDAEEPPMRLWTITSEISYWTFACTDEAGEVAQFDYRKIMSERTHYRFHQSLLARRQQREDAARA